MKLDKFLIHEALDRTSFIIDIIDEGIYYHPVFKKNKKLRKKLNKSIELLNEVYQEIGSTKIKNEKAK